MELKVIPRISEKSYLMAAGGIFTFEVPVKANKQQVASAVAAQYGVTVTGVNIVIAKGKVKRSFRKGGKFSIGKRTDVKKAYVSLAEGQSIPAFEQEAK